MLDKSNIALICILGMFAGFLVSPAVLSISMFLYGVSALRDVHPRRWLENKWWLLGVAWIACYALTYFWSDNKEYWGVGLQVKLPFLLLPLAFSYTPRFSDKQRQTFTLCVGLLMLAGAGYSLSFLISDPAQYLLGYRVSHLLPTPSRNDHICFSLSVTLYIIWCIYSWPMLTTMLAKWFVGIVVWILVLFIHVLAAKSGVVSFYLFLACWGLYLAFTKRKLVGIIVLIAIPLLVVFGKKYISTFRDRKEYMDFSIMMLKQRDRSGNYGDIGRIWSYTIGLKLIRQHPLLGVGSGDMLDEMKKGYDQWHPEVVDENRLIPHNQFLIVALCAGIPAMLIFTVWALVPLTWLRRNRQSFFFFMVWLVLMFYLVIDTALEVQMGVFIFVFFLLLQKQELPNLPGINK